MTRPLRHPPRPRPLDRLRLARRIAQGLPPRRAGRAEGMEGDELAALLADPAFAALVAALKALAARPEAERVERLTDLAYGVIEEALVRGDARVALFVLRERAQGRNPARTLAQGVAATLRQQAPPPAAAKPARPTPTRPPRRPAHPVDRGIARAAAGLRAALAREELLHRPAASPRSAAALPGRSGPPATPACGPEPVPPAAVAARAPGPGSRAPPGQEPAGARGAAGR